MSTLQDVHLISAVRTAFGRNRGGLSTVRTDDLAALPIAELVARHPALDPASVDDVYLGNTNGAGEENRNVARMAALLAGLPVTVAGVTLNRLCASGGEALVQAGRTVATGESDLVIAGGVEGMSRAPYVVPKPEEALPRAMAMHQTTVGWRMANPKFPPAWTDSLGACAERVAHELGIGRAEQDEWAARSHQLADAAWNNGCHDDVVLPVKTADGTVTRDEGIRPESTAQTLSGLRPAFTDDGSVTAGNSSPISDGALAALVGTRGAADRLGGDTLGQILGSATVGVEPDRFSLAPVPAITKLLDRTGFSHDDIDLWEINEAFAAMVLSTRHHLPKIDDDRLNVNGGAIAVGHPLGASAPRVVVDLCRELRRRGGGLGIAAACIGVGQGQAILVKVA